MRRGLEDEQGQWGKQIRDDWKKKGVKSVKQWCEKVEDRCWLANRLGGNKKKGDASTMTPGIT